MEKTNETKRVRMNSIGAQAQPLHVHGSPALKPAHLESFGWALRAHIYISISTDVGLQTYFHDKVFVRFGADCLFVLVRSVSITM